MQDFLPSIKKSLLFEGIEEHDIASMLSCLAASKRCYRKDEFILSAGDQVSSLGLVLSGRCHIVKDDFWGSRNIVAEIGPGEIFAESFACAAGAELSVSVLAAENTTALFMDARRTLSVCSSACQFHARLVRNLLAVLAAKNIQMNEKLGHVTQRSTRKKLLAYLSSAAQKSGADSFEISFNRQELADYLAADRSALSAELGRMRDEGLLEFDKNHFVLKSGAKTDF